MLWSIVVNKNILSYPDLTDFPEKCFEVGVVVFKHSNACHLKCEHLINPL